MAGEPQDLDELIRHTIDPLQLMQRVGDQLVTMIDRAEGAIVGLQIDASRLRFVSGSGFLAPQVGRSLPMRGSLCGETIRTGTTQVTQSIVLSGPRAAEWLRHGGVVVTDDGRYERLEATGAGAPTRAPSQATRSSSTVSRSGSLKISWKTPA